MGRMAGSAAALAFGALVLWGQGVASADTSEPGVSGMHRPNPRSTPHPVPAVAKPRKPSHRPAGNRRAAASPTTSLVNLPTYWPMFTTNEKRRFDYTSADGSLAPVTAVFAYDRATKSMLYQEYNADMTWQDTWYYRAKPGYGIAEWRDDYPRNPTGNGPVKKVVMSVPIGWGANLPVGGEYHNRPVFSLFRSSPPQIGLGRQDVKLEALLTDFTTRDGTVYHDVVQFLYRQKWGRSARVGARYWMAKGVGPVAIQWVGEDPITHRVVESVRIDAVVTTTFGGP